MAARPVRTVLTAAGPSATPQLRAVPGLEAPPSGGPVPDPATASSPGSQMRPRQQWWGLAILAPTILGSPTRSVQNRCPGAGAYCELRVASGTAQWTRPKREFARRYARHAARRGVLELLPSDFVGRWRADTLGAASKAGVGRICLRVRPKPYHLAALTARPENVARKMRPCDSTWYETDELLTGKHIGRSCRDRRHRRAGGCCGASGEAWRTRGLLPGSMTGMRALSLK